MYDKEIKKQLGKEMAKKLKYVASFGVVFGILAALAFLGGLMIDLQIAPAPMSANLFELSSFGPVMAIGSIILAWLEGFLVLWMKAKHAKWLPLFSFVVAVLLGGAVAFFSMYLIWGIVTLINLLMVWVLCRLYGCTCAQC